MEGFTEWVWWQQVLLVLGVAIAAWKAFKRFFGREGKIGIAHEHSCMFCASQNVRIKIVMQQNPIGPPVQLGPSMMQKCLEWAFVKCGDCAARPHSSVRMTWKPVV